MVRGRGYGQFCPVAQAAEIVAERWTPLILRELLAGSRRFNDLRKGVPLMSPSLLSKRLKALEDSGVIARSGDDGSEYQLTRAGEALRPVIELLGRWGQRWIERDIRADELDPALLMWDVRRGVLPQPSTERRSVVQFDLLGAPTKKSRWWLVFDRGDVDLCLRHPGHAIDLHVTAPLRVLVEVWIGKADLGAALRGEEIQLEGSRSMTRGFRQWFRLSPFAKSESSAPS